MDLEIEEIMKNATALAFEGVEQEEIEKRLSLYIKDPQKRKAANIQIQNAVFSYQAALAKKAQLKDRALFYLFCCLFGIGLLFYSFIIIRSHIIRFTGGFLAAGYFAVTNYQNLRKDLTDIELDKRSRINDRKERRF